MKNIYESNDGNISILFSFTLILIIVSAGISVDYARAWVAREKVQEISDMAALAALRQAPSSESDARRITDKWLAAEGSIGNAQISSLRLSTDSNGVSLDLTVTSSVNTLFLNVLGMPELSADASTLARLSTGAGGCLVGLGDDNDSAVRIEANTDIAGPECQLHAVAGNVGSLSEDASTATFDRICAGAGYSVNAIATTDVEDCADRNAIVRPTVPLPTVGACDFTFDGLRNLESSSPSGQPFRFQPGVYCADGVRVFATAASHREYIFEPGLYIFSNFHLAVLGSPRVIADGVTFYLATPESSLQLGDSSVPVSSNGSGSSSSSSASSSSSSSSSSSAGSGSPSNPFSSRPQTPIIRNDVDELQMSAPTSGPYAGVLVIQNDQPVPPANTTASVQGEVRQGYDLLLKAISARVSGGVYLETGHATFGLTSPPNHEDEIEVLADNITVEESDWNISPLARSSSGSGSGDLYIAR